MNGKQFIRRVRKLARNTNTLVKLSKEHGKGSHETLYYGARRTTVKYSEIGTSLFHKMCKDLGINHNAL